MSLELRKLSKDTDCSQFSSFDCHYSDGYRVADHLEQEICDLSSYLTQGSLYALTKGYGVSYLAYMDKNLAGFFTINAGHIIFDKKELNKTEGLEELNKKPYISFPAVKIVRLAVSNEYQGMREDKIGDQLISAVETISHQLSKSIGIRFLKVDALADYRTLKFYTRVGFKPHYDRKNLQKYEAIMEGNYKENGSSVSMYLDLQKTKK